MSITRFSLILISLVLSQFAFAGNLDKIDPSLLEKYETTQINSVIIVFNQQADVSMSTSLLTKLEKANYVINKLKATANRTQTNVQTILNEHNIPFKSFYVMNGIQANIDLDLLLKLSEQSEIKMIVNDADTPKLLERKVTNMSSLRAGEPEWGISIIKADSAWLLGFRGEGVIVGGQDTGYDFDLDLLIKKYRGYDATGNYSHDYNWHDAIREINPLHVDSTLIGLDSILSDINYSIDSIFMDTTFVSLDTINIDSVFIQVDSMLIGQINPCGLDLTIPCDDNGHGSHTMGTMVGGDTTNIIGVAPDAKWIACRNMERGWGKPSSYIECFEWFMNPTDINDENPDPSKAPHVINNSWGCPPVEGCHVGNFSIMEQVVNNLESSGIAVVVSAGNDGPQCETISNPASIFLNSITIGATDKNDVIAGFSSRGLVTSDSSFRLKPDVCAPGVSVRSCVPGNKFRTSSGTSMAGPHVAGTIALMISANPGLAGHVSIIKDILIATAVPLTSDELCNGYSDTDVPNPTYGHGRIDALAAVKMAVNTVIESTTSAGENTLAIDFYPNPVMDDLIVQSDKLFFGSVNLDVYDVNGRLIRSERWSEQGALNHEIDLKEIGTGVLIFKVTYGDSMISKKIVKIK